MNLFITFFLLFYFIHCNIQPPPFTFTQTQTAAERQMIGEDKNIEPNGWLIASIKTSSSGSENWKQESFEELETQTDYKEYYTILQTIAYLAPEIKRLKKGGLIGENLEGKLSENPLFDWKNPPEAYLGGDAKKRVTDVIRLVNDYREKVFQKRVEIEANRKADKQLELTKKIELGEFKEKQKLIYYHSVEVGEFYEAEKNKWVKK